MTDLIIGDRIDLHAASKRTVEEISRQHNVSVVFSGASRPRISPGRPMIPDPAIFSDLSESADCETVTPSQCGVHLVLLELFHDLRTEVINSPDLDVTFGVIDEKQTVFRREYDRTELQWYNRPHQLKDKMLPRKRRSKWPYFLEIAVGRFLVWAKEMEHDLCTTALGVMKLDHPLSEAQTLRYLPPLDVLMVWHAFLLNPGDYHKYCNREDLKYLPKILFPWKDIYRAIDSATGTYSLSVPEKLWLEEHHLESDLFQYLARIGPEKAPIAGVLEKRIKGGYTNEPSLTSLHSLRGISQKERDLITTLQKGITDSERTKRLADNVQRQGLFVDKMYNHLWIRSPGAAGTLRRAVERYENFLELFRLYPGTMLVPTLDIDLAWHTHQLSAQIYSNEMKKRCGRFINHDDKIGSSQLNVSMEKTAELYTIRFGQEYSTCLCWDCEAVLGKLEVFEENDGLGDDFDSKKLAEQVRQEVEYFRNMELARRSGKESPPINATHD